MRLDWWMLECVAFIVRDATDEHGVAYKEPYGTGFFVFHPNETVAENFTQYMVTARHLIEEQLSESIYIRINRRWKRGAGYIDVATKKSDWYIHENADVATIVFVHPPDPGPSWGAAAGIDVEQHFVDADHSFRGHPFTPEMLAPIGGGLKLAVGDPILFAGLFHQHAGTVENLPIARSGMLSRLPSEPIHLPRFDGTQYFDTEAYLVEAHSWGGHSGSPAYWTFEIIAVQNGIQIPQWVTGLLGLVSAHIDIHKKAERSGEFHNLGGEIEVGLNSGIAVITPASKIKELLVRDDVKKDRAGRAAKSKLSRSQFAKVTMDSAPPSRQTFDKAAMETALKKVSRKSSPSPPDEASQRT